MLEIARLSIKTCSLDWNMEHYVIVTQAFQLRKKNEVIKKARELICTDKELHSMLFLEDMELQCNNPTIIEMIFLAVKG